GRDNHPWFAALAVPNIDEDPLPAKLTHVRPFERLYLALPHTRVDGPEDEIGEPFGLLASDRNELDPFLDGQQPLSRNGASDRVGIRCRRFFNEAGSNGVIEDRTEGVELTLDRSRSRCLELARRPSVHVSNREPPKWSCPEERDEVLLHVDLGG